MLVLHGLTPPQTCKRNITHTWQLFWARAVNLFCIEEPCTWTVSTAHGKFYSDKVKLQIAITQPALLDSDVPLSKEDLPEAWVEAMHHASMVAASDTGKRAQPSGGRPRASAIRMRLQAAATTDLLIVPTIAPCASSVLPHVSAADDWTAEMYANAGLQARYKCPACDKNYAFTSGIHSHWEVSHPDESIPFITQARTRIRVPCNADVAAELRLAREDAAARTLAANLWLSQQAVLAAALASDKAAVSMPVVTAPASAAVASDETAAVSMPVVVAAPTWYLHPQPGVTATQPRYKCPACSKTFGGTSGIHNHWPKFHAGDAFPEFTQESTRVFVPIMRA
jgi:transposase-like protein